MKKKNRIIVWAALLCLTAALCAGCGAGASEPEEEPTVSEADDGAKSNKDDRAGDSAKEGEGTKANEGAEANDSGKEDDDAKSNDGSETPDSKANGIVGVQELVGDVQEIGEGRFVIAKAELEEDENGGQIMTSSVNPDEESFVTVVYGDDTTFTKRTIYDGGARYEDADGSSADLAEGMEVELTGSYEGGEYRAKTVRLVTVIW